MVRLAEQWPSNSVTVMLGAEVLGWAETDDQSMRIAPATSRPGRQPPDEIDITNLWFTPAALQKLGNPALLFEVLTRAPFKFKIIDQNGQPFRTLPNCTPKDLNQYLTVPIKNSSLFRITVMVV